MQPDQIKKVAIPQKTSALNTNANGDQVVSVTTSTTTDYTQDQLTHNRAAIAAAQQASNDKFQAQLDDIDALLAQFPAAPAQMNTITA